jgi:CRISPR-associated endoribonuclease Cas6
MMPVRWAITLHVERPELVLPGHVHALICECLERDVAATRHYGNDKPFSTSPLRTHDDGLFAFEVGLLDDDLEDRLMTGIRRRGRRLQLGRQAALIAGQPQTMRRSSWQELTRHAVPRREYRFDFVTPTAFRSGQTSVPLPLPKLIFGHYRSRWNVFAPPELRPDVPFDDLELAISGHDIATTCVRMSRREQIGFTGWVVLTLRSTHAEVCTELDALAAVADYSGTGSGTPQGMGVTRYLGGPVVTGGPTSRVRERAGGWPPRLELDPAARDTVETVSSSPAGPRPNTTPRLQRTNRQGAD